MTFAACANCGIVYIPTRGGTSPCCGADLATIKCTTFEMQVLMPALDSPLYDKPPTPSTP
jgi:hypothetical protein